jgi:hypothetical protein
VKLMEGVNPDTVWTWNAIGKRAGAWGLAPTAPEATRGFLLNHLIADLLPEQAGGYRYSNSDPVTGQAAWYDLRVRVEKAARNEAHETSPRFAPLHAPPSPRSSHHAESVSSTRREGRGEGQNQGRPQPVSAPHPNPLPTEEWGEGTVASGARS